MIAKKVTRYYAECGKGFWNKQKALNHESACKCWKNPKIKSCVSCKYRNIASDFDETDLGVESWSVNNCKYSEFGIPIHKDFEFIRRNCKHHELK